MGFIENFKSGQVGESLIARWLRRKGYSVLPVYDVELGSGKGPRLFAENRQLIAPDMFVFKSGYACWIEAKHKSAFTWHRITGEWVTGIDLKYYDDYCTIADETAWSVWLFFLQRGGRAKGDEEDSPSGLFGNDLSVLRKCEHHRYNDDEKHSMVYWNCESLKMLATLKELES